MEPTPLAAVQQWMLSAISSLPADTVLPRYAVADVVSPSRALSAEDRLAVYQGAYFARLKDCLQSEFPAVAKAMGEEAFTQIVAAYLLRKPPSSYTLGNLGRDFPAILEELQPQREKSAPDFGDFLVELARYERLIAEVFDEDGPEADATTSLAAQTGGAVLASSLDVAAVSLNFYPCVRLAEFAFPVHEFSTAVRHGGAADVPAARPVHLVMTREDFVVRRWETPRWQWLVLQSLQSGLTLAAALARLDELPEDQLPPTPWTASIATAFRSWAEANLFRRELLSNPPFF